MVWELGVADQAVPTILRERMSMMAVSQGRRAAFVDTPENRSLRTQTSCWPWSETQIWLGTSVSKSVQQVGLTTFLKLALALPAQDQQGLGQLLQIRPDGAVAGWSGAPGLQIPQIAQQGLVHQPNRQPLTQVLVFEICADRGMGFEKPRFSLIRANSVDQPRIAELAVLCIPVPESSGADMVLIGEVAGQRVHASHGNSADGTERWTGSLAAAGEFHQRRNGFQTLQGLRVLPCGKVEALGLGDLRQRSKQLGLAWIRAQRQNRAVWS